MSQPFYSDAKTAKNVKKRTTEFSLLTLQMSVCVSQIKAVNTTVALDNVRDAGSLFQRVNILSIVTQQSAVSLQMINETMARWWCKLTRVDLLSYEHTCHFTGPSQHWRNEKKDWYILADDKSLLEQHPPVLNWQCQLTQADLHNSHKMAHV